MQGLSGIKYRCVACGEPMCAGLCTALPLARNNVKMWPPFIEAMIAFFHYFFSKQ